MEQRKWVTTVSPCDSSVINASNQYSLWIPSVAIQTVGQMSLRGQMELTWTRQDLEDAPMNRVLSGELRNG